jgi:IS30 family transposase
MIELRMRWDLSNREIARRLNMPQTTVTSELSRLRAVGFNIPEDPYNRSAVRRVNPATRVDRQARSLRDALAERGIEPGVEVVG